MASVAKVVAVIATQLFLLDTVASTHLGTDSFTANGTGSNVGWVSKALGTSRGSGVVASSNVATVTGAVTPVQIGGVSAEWISPPVAADVTISASITLNLWAAESNMSADVALQFCIDIIRANTTTTRNSNTIQNIIPAEGALTELAVTTRAVRAGTASGGGYTPQTLNRGDRIRVRVITFTSQVTGFTWNLGYNGATAAADGDTYVTFTENFSFESAPAGSVLYLTNEQSGLTAAPALISSFTGSDENPLSEGGNWAVLNTAVANRALQRVSNAAVGQAAGTCMSYWTPANFGPDLEAYVTAGTATPQIGIAVRIQGEGGSNTWDGYLVLPAAGFTQIFAVTNGSPATLVTGTNSTWAVGDKLGVRCEGSTIQAWRQASGSGTWNLVCTVVDTTYSSAGKVALRSDSTTQIVDDFYAATDSNLFTQKAWTSRGAGVVSYLSDTDAGWTAPLYTHDWYTPELEAFTLTGMAQANIRALESNASANASLRCELARVNSDGTEPDGVGVLVLRSHGHRQR